MTGPNSRPLFTQLQLARLKPDLAVRTLGEFRERFLLWVAVFFAGFYVVHVLWRIRGFNGEQGILPILHLLTGVGLCLMVGLRDPLRDTLAFADFARAVALSIGVVAAVSFIDVPRVFSRLSFVPLLGALGLSLALIAFGTGPGSSDKGEPVWVSAG